MECITSSVGSIFSLKQKNASHNNVNVIKCKKLYTCRVGIQENKMK